MVLLAAALCLFVCGCAGYQVGTRSLYRPDIRTVYVPMFESNALRRYMGQWLTEAVAKQIEMQTPYKVVHSPAADSVMTGRILSIKKQVLTENPNDEPRDIALGFAVQVTWYAANGQVLMQHYVNVDSHFLPESGQSVSTAQQDVVEGLAREIVSRMETINW